MSEEAEIISPGPIKSWHPQQETILKNWGEAAACFRYIHHQSFMAYAKTTQRATLPVIILTQSPEQPSAMESVPENRRRRDQSIAKSHRGVDRDDKYV